MEVRKKIEESLRGMKYCFPNLEWSGQTTYPVLNEEEFQDFVDFICSVVNSYREKSFLAGFFSGCENTFKDINPKDFEFNEDVCKAGASKYWQEYDK